MRAWTVLEEGGILIPLAKQPEPEQEEENMNGENTMAACEHFENLSSVTPSADGCEECLQMGDSWVHLRICLVCGHVGCCDSSKNKHATKHYHATGHAVIQSFEPQEAWAWCYVDKLLVESMPKRWSR